MTTPQFSEVELKMMRQQMGAVRARTGMLRHVDAWAVGHGITAAIHQVQNDNSPDTPETWVAYCERAAREAYQDAMANPPHIEPGPVARLLEEIDGTRAEDRPIDGQLAIASAREAAALAYRCCMPRLTGRRMTQAYIACVAAGVQHKYFTGSEATSLLYTAQLALAAYPHRRAKRG